MPVSIQTTAQNICVRSPLYSWQWDAETDRFCLLDAHQRLIAGGCHQPLVLTTLPGSSHLLARRNTFEVLANRVTVHYSGLNGDARLAVTWNFNDTFITLDPLQYETPDPQDLVQVVYFARPDSASPQQWVPTLAGRYAVVPGLCMSTCISPVVDLHAHLATTAVLGSGAMRGPGLTQQWGLPAHYFCMFSTAEKWNAAGAAKQQSGAVCWGLRALPAGDERLEIRSNALSPLLNLRSDLWKQVKTPGKVELGLSFLLTFAPQYHEAVRSYYRALLDQGVIRPKLPGKAKKAVLLSPQYNTWGVESALGMKPEELTGAVVADIYQKFRASGMKARTFVVDDKWEGRYGELAHDQDRFPHFESMLERIRADGHYIGLWAAFLRCQDPSLLGLDESHLLQTPAGQPLWLDHQAARYGIFDVTQPEVQRVLSARAKEFVRRYRPDLIKFDFGYELPSLDVAAPADMNWAGERLLQKGLEVVVGAMKAENPDLVIMYYGLSPLLIDYYDLHSPDDLVYCGGDYDLETNRRIFFSSLCGELGMPTYGSSGYDWASARDIWFDSAPSGTLGSLHGFDADENGDLPRPEWIAVYNGLAAVIRPSAAFQVYPLEASWQGGLRAAFSPSWERMEQGLTVLIALRTHRLDGKTALCSHKDILHTDFDIVLASLTADSITTSARLGLVPLGFGKCTLQHTPAAQPGQQVRLISHFFGGALEENTTVYPGAALEISISPPPRGLILEWLEILF